MAKYLSNIDLSKNQLQNAALHPVGTAPASPVEGQVYFDTSVGDKKMYYWDGSSWIFMGSQGDITSISSNTTAQLTVTNGGGPNPSLTIVTGAVGAASTALATGAQIYNFVTGLGYVESVTEDNTSTFVDVTIGGTAVDPTVGAELNATGTPSATTFLRGDNTWASISDNDTTYDLTGTGSTNGTAGVLLTGSDATTDTVLIVGAGTTTVTRSGNTLTVTSNDQYDGTVTSVGLSMPSAFTVTNSPVTSSGTLTVTGAGTTSQYVDGTGALQTFPTNDNYQYWTLTDGSTSTNITSTATATFQGTANEVEVAESSGTITIGLPDDVTITGELTVSGTGQSSFGGQVTIPTTPVVSTDAASKAYVDNAVVGNLVYQGGYNAATNTPDLDSSPSSSIKKGWTYTVTADGSFFTEQVRVGDVLIAEVDAPTALADWTTVQNNIDLASSSIVGIGNVVPGSSNTITAPYSSGTATLDVVDSTASQKGAVIVGAGTGISVAYSSGTATVTNTETNSSNTDSGQITAGSTSGTVTHNFGTTNVIVQTYLDNATDNYPTVFCDVTRASNSVTATIATAESDDIIILVQKIG